MKEKEEEPLMVQTIKTVLARVERELDALEDIQRIFAEGFQMEALPTATHDLCVICNKKIYTLFPLCLKLWQQVPDSPELAKIKVADDTMDKTKAKFIDILTRLQAQEEKAVARQKQIIAQQHLQPKKDKELEHIECDLLDFLFWFVIFAQHGYTVTKEQNDTLKAIFDAESKMVNQAIIEHKDSVQTCKDLLGYHERK